MVVVAGRGECREVVLGVRGRWVWCQAGGRLAPGAGVGCGAGWAGGGQKKPRQALEARRLRHAERTVLPAVAQSKKGGGGLVGPAWAGVVVGCDLRRAVASAGGEGWGVRVVRGGVSGVGARLSAVQSWALGVGGVRWREIFNPLCELLHTSVNY